MNHTSAVKAVATTLMLSFASGCASMERQPVLAGSSPSASWQIERVTTHIDDYRTEWRYVLRLRDTTGRGLHLTRVTRRFMGPEFLHWDRWIVDIDLRVPAGAEIDFPCGHAVWARGGRPAQLWYLTEKRIYTGTDGSGAPTQIELDLPFGDLAATAQPAPLLFFAGFTADRASATTNPPCESFANRRTVFDIDAAGSVHFLVAVDNNRGRVPIKTRWLSPANEEVKVEEGVIRERYVSAGYLFAHETHSLSIEQIGRRAGRWSVELFLQGAPAGVYSFDVQAGGAPGR